MHAHGGHSQGGHGHGGHSHGGHSHGGHAARPFDARRALLISLVLNAGFLVIEVLAGWLTGSLALLSDAAHMVSDVAALGLAFLAATWVRRPATPERTYGLLRAEILGAFVNAVVLMLACMLIFKEAIERLVAGPQPVPGGPVLAVGAVGLAINLGSAWVLWRSTRQSGTGDLNVRGALAHMLADALGSVGAMVSALLTMFAHVAAADAAASLAIGALVLYGTWGILRDSTHVLLEAVPTGVRQPEIGAALLSLEGVASVHDLHIWSIGSGQTVLTAHLGLHPAASPAEVLRRAEARLREDFGVGHTTLQVEPVEVGPCRQVHCGLLGEAHGVAHEADDADDDDPADDDAGQGAHAHGH